MDRGTFSGDWSGVRSGTTDGLGQLVVETQGVKGGSIWNFCVDTAIKSGMDLDRSVNPGLLCGGPVTTGTVSGVVTDSSGGSPIPGASVNADTGQSTSTASDGSYKRWNTHAERYRQGQQRLI